MRRSLIASIGVAAALLVAAGPGASAAQGPKAGVVIVTTRLAYSGGAATGTGIVLTPSGQVLTNNHVIRGAGSIRVTVPAGSRTYDATVAGYSVSKDVALLELRGASGLRTVQTGNSSAVRVGDSVTAVGNAGGGGLSLKRGRVTALGQSITVADDPSPVTLGGLIETTAPLRPGDSGGPMLSGGRVIGLNAAASGGIFRGGGEGFAIPINRALKIAAQIAAGRSSSTVHVGPTAFLGVALARTPDGYEVDGALVSGVASGSPAAKAGIGKNDLITFFAGRRVRSAAALKGLVLRSRPGRLVRVTWLDGAEGRTSATVRLVSGPPQ